MSNIIKNPVKGKRSSRLLHNTNPANESIEEIQQIIQKVLMLDENENPVLINDIKIDWEEVAGGAVVPDQVLRITLGADTYELNVKKIV
jgi:hypothetical protein